jgi:hypothetical protein
MLVNRKSLLLVLSAALGLASAAQVRGDHTVLQQHAEELAFQMEDLRDVFRHQFRRAGNYPELRSTAWDVRLSAKRIGRLARAGRDLCEFRAEIDAVTSCLRILELEVANARFRADQGLDPPLNGCTLHVDGRLAAARETAHCLAQIASGNPAVIFGGGWQTGRPPINSGYPGYPTPYGNRGGYDPNPGGSIPYQGGAPVTSPAPGYAPEPTPAPPRGTLPPGNSHGQYEEIGPPLNPSMSGLGNPHGRGGHLPETGNGRPVGLYGQRGNGVELSNGGVVLKLGGASIRIR